MLDVSTIVPNRATCHTEDFNIALECAWRYKRAFSASMLGDAFEQLPKYAHRKPGSARATAAFRFVDLRDSGLFDVVKRINPATNHMATYIKLRPMYANSKTPPVVQFRQRKGAGNHHSAGGTATLIPGASLVALAHDCGVSPSTMRNMIFHPETIKQSTRLKIVTALVQRRK